MTFKIVDRMGMLTLVGVGAILVFQVFVRRSRDRVGPSADDKEDKEAFYQTCHEVLVTLSKILAPFMPFVAEEMYRNLTGEESVHLSDWPNASLQTTDYGLQFIEQMNLVRRICEFGNAKRKELGIKVRQPLAELRIKNSELRLKDEGLEQLIKDELNVKEVKFEEGQTGQKGIEGLEVQLDSNITPELKEEGEAREIVRNIQDARKELGTALDDKVIVTLPEWPVKFEEYIKKQTLATQLLKGESLKVERV